MIPASFIAVYVLFHLFITILHLTQKRQRQMSKRQKQTKNIILIFNLLFVCQKKKCNDCSRAYYNCINYNCVNCRCVICVFLRYLKILMKFQNNGRKLIYILYFQAGTFCGGHSYLVLKLCVNWLDNLLNLLIKKKQLLKLNQRLKKFVANK